MRSYPCRPPKPAVFLALLLGWMGLGPVSILGPEDALGQSVRGRVLEEGSDKGIEGVELLLLGARGDTVGRTLSGSDGLFQLLALVGGSYRIQARHLAYRPFTSPPLELRSFQEVVLDLALSATAIPLEPLTITARRLDPRMGSTVEGFYARQRMSAQGHGFGWIVTRVDPMMVNATDAREVLQWFRLRERCTIVYWNGNLVVNPEVAQDWIETPAAYLEGLEYYPNVSDAPAPFREIPVYLQDSVFCSVLALWAKTGYYGDPVPSPPSHKRLHVALVLQDLSGKLAPDLGVGLETSLLLPVSNRLALGGFLRRTSHHLSGPLLRQTLEGLVQVPWVLPSGSRPFSLWAFGVEGRFVARDEGRIRPVVTGRAGAGLRSFTLVSNSFGEPTERLSSWGLGLGGAVGAEVLLGRRFTLHLAVELDRFAFEPYSELERNWYTSAAGWTARSLRVGAGYVPGR
jgi:hypothetical protein